MDTFQNVASRMPLLPYVREAGYAVRNPWHIADRSLLDYLLIYVQDGAMTVGMNGREQRIERGEFCLLQPGDVHSLEATTRTITPFIHFDLFYNPLREQSFPTRSGQVDLSAYRHLAQPRLNDLQGIDVPLIFRPERPSAFKETMLRMIGLWLEGDVLQRLEAEHLAMELALAMLRGNAAFKTGKLQKPQSLNWITSYFSFHLAETIPLADMAKRAQLSPSRFGVVFKAEYGMSPHRYLLHLRIQHAQELLANASYTIQEIAEYCGFSDVHHLSKSFRKITGETPNRYRKENAK